MNAILALSICVFLGSYQPSSQDTRRTVLEAYYQKLYAASCVGTPREKEPVYLESIKYCDVDGDGIEEAIVIGSSCGSGTGGSDIHDVLKLNADGTISDITPREAEKYGDTFEGHPIYDQLVGNMNYEISFEDGFLYYIFRDASGRPKPLVLKFKWVNGKFKLIEVVKNGLTLRSTRTPPALSFALSQLPSSSAPLIASAQAGPVSFLR